MKKIDKNEWRNQKEPYYGDFGVEVKTSKKQKEVLKSLRNTIDDEVKKNCIEFVTFLFEQGILFQGNYLQEEKPEDLYKIWKEENIQK